MWWAWMILGILIVLLLLIVFAMCRLSGTWSRMEERRELEQRMKDICKE